MFTVQNKVTGETYKVYAVNGLYFLTYDEDYDRWYSILMDECRHVKAQEVSADA